MCGLSYTLEALCHLANWHNPPLRFRGKRAILKAYQERNQMFYVAQLQPDTDTVEVIYTCTSEQQAIDECERTNAHLADAGIPGEYYFFVL